MRVLIYILFLISALFASKEGAIENLSGGISVLEDDININKSINNSIFNLPKDIKDSRDWTIIVYMDGDNDLEDFALKDLNEMENAIEDNIDIIVLVDRAKGYTKKDGDWSDTRVYQIKKDTNLNKVNSKLLQKLGEQNMGDPKLLSDFLASAIKSFPAKHYALIMWNHGGGWSNNAHDLDAPNSITKRDYLTLNELSSAIKEALNKINIDRLDLIGFDMCLMSQIEIAYAIKDYFKVMVASEANEPGDGWPYSSVLPEFAKGTKGARGIATSIVDSYNRFYLTKGVQMYTVSALDLTMIDSVIKSFNEITQKVSLYLDNGWSVISRSLFFSEAYQARIEDIKRAKGAIASIDMMDALKSVVKNTKLKQVERDYENFVDVVDRFVLSRANSNSRKRSNGISIYAPVMEQNYNRKYENIAFAKHTYWAKFLNALYAKQKQNTTTARIYDMQTVSFKDGNIKPIDMLIPMETTGFKYKVDGKGILWIQGIYGVKDQKDGGLIAQKVGTILNAGGSLLDKKKKKNIAYKLDMFIPDYKDGINNGNLYFDGLYYLLYADGKLRFATVVEPLGSSFIQVPVIYESKKYGRLNGNIYFNKKSWQSLYIEAYIPQQNGSVVTRIIKPASDDKVTLNLIYITKDGKVTNMIGDSFLWKDGCELILNRFKEGDYRLALFVNSFNGINSAKLYDFKVGTNKVLEGAIDSISKSPYKDEDFIGAWEEIDGDAFIKSGKIIKLKEVAIFEKTKSKKFLNCYIGKRNNKNYDKAYSVYLDFRLFPHMRYFKLEDNTKGSSNKDIDNFKVLFTMLYKLPNMYIMLQQDTLTYKFKVYAKSVNTKSSNQNLNQTTNSNTQQSYQQNTQYTQNGSNNIDGVWQSRDGDRLYFSQGQYQLVQNGTTLSQGVYKIKNSYLYLIDSNTNTQLSFSFLIKDNNLLLQDSNGQRYLYTRLTQTNTTNTTNTNSISNEYAKFSGTWQMSNGAILIVQGNRYQTYENGVVTDNGIFEIRANNILISKSIIRNFTYQYRYKINKDYFELIDKQGNVYKYYKKEY